MNLLARFMRFVVWVVILSWGVRLLGRFFAWALQNGAGSEQQAGTAANDNARASADGSTSRTSGAQSDPAARQLVRDPVCGMHMAETLAIPFRDRGELLHFCSAECRDKYTSGMQRLAANA